MTWVFTEVEPYDRTFSTSNSQFMISICQGSEFMCLCVFMGSSGASLGCLVNWASVSEPHICDFNATFSLYIP